MASSATKLVFSVLLWCLQAFPHCAEEGEVDPGCRQFSCGEKLGNLKFPFCNTTHPKCGFFIVDGCNQANQTIQLVQGSGKRYDLLDIYPSGIIHVRDNTLQRHLDSNDCRAFNNLSLPNSSSLLSLSVLSSIDIFKCRHGFNSSSLPPRFADFNYTGCEGYTIYYIPSISKPLPTVLSDHCSFVQLPVHNRTLMNSSHDPFQFITPEFYLDPRISDYCVECSLRGRVCRYDSKGRTLCQNIGNGNFSKKLRIAIGSGGAAIFILMICLVLFIMRRRGYRPKTASSGLISKEKDKVASLESELDTGSAYCGVPIFPYHELEKATNYFDSTRELGDGGFGTVYYGILQDGREVAVKRLYENNYKRVQQFMNEIKILTGLRHKNLVTLYGCTSLHSRELILVYEFIANGTVADHVHGDRATHTSLAWPVRLRIAAEAANALAYLHASGIIHRDVKTSNILLDNNFSVKVADFGLSRLFPTDATHVSTAPQGTPGYVDPEYHKCYQLTERSDVYSFGVVLIELISSLPAVDISRDKEEINLASLAVNRIQNQEFSEFLDPCLKFESDLGARKMVVLVAELAFQCLQPDREQRPSMEEVLRTLKSIQGEHDDVYKAAESAADDDNSAIPIPLTGSTVDRTPAVRETEDGVSLKGTNSFTSPTSVTDTWASRSTISSSSTV